MLKFTHKAQPVESITAGNDKGRTLTVSETKPKGTKLRFTIESSKDDTNPVNTIAITKAEAAALVAAMQEHFGLELASA